MTYPDGHRCPTYAAEQFCYLIVCEDAVKIGVSGNPTRRLTQIRGTARPGARLVAIVAGSRATEHLLHVAFADLALGGEWFRLAGPLAALVEHYDQHRPPPPLTLPADGRITADMI